MKDLFALFIFAFIMLGVYSVYLYISDPYEFHQIIDRDISKNN